MKQFGEALVIFMVSSNSKMKSGVRITDVGSFGMWSLWRGANEPI